MTALTIDTLAIVQILRKRGVSEEQAIGVVEAFREIDAGAAMGEPWRSAFAPAALRERLLALGCSEAETFEPDDLNRLYLARRKDGLHAFVRLPRARV
jgi:hypothetical protein